MQDLMIEALDGFVLVLLFDGTIIYLSENVHKYLGLFQVATYVFVCFCSTYVHICTCCLTFVPSIYPL